MASLSIARAGALVALVVNVVFNALYPSLGLEEMRTVSDRFHHLLTPAPFTFAIWGMIYGALGIYTLYALLPSQRSATVHDAIAPALIGWNVLAIGWIAVFGSGAPVLALPIILVMLALAVRTYALAMRTPRPGALPWRLAPFALLTSWMSVATVENVIMCVRAAGHPGGDVGWAAVVLIAVVMLGVALTARGREPFSAAVVAWACAGIAVEAGSTGTVVPTLAIGACVGAAVVAVLAAARPHLARALAPATA